MHTPVEEPLAWHNTCCSCSAGDSVIGQILAQQGLMDDVIAAELQQAGGMHASVETPTAALAGWYWQNEG